MHIKNRINWKLFWVLLIASGLSIVAIMPYMLTLQGDVLRSAPLPLPLVILVSVIQSIVLFAVFIFIGLRIAKKIGLKLPLLENLVNKQKIPINIKSLVVSSVLLGCFVGITIVLLDFLFTKLGVTISLYQSSIPLWQGFLASFYGGISEEIVMRLFFMTGILWVVSKFTKSNLIENNMVIWTSIIIAALVFGLGHLPVTESLTTITPLVVVRALVLNGIGGILFGWLYWKKGLESAIIAHFSADIILQIIFPLILIIIFNR